MISIEKLKLNPLAGDQYLMNLVEEFDPSTKIVKTTLTIDSFANSDAGEYSCRLAKDGSTSQVTEDSIILKLQGLFGCWSIHY